MIIWWPPPVGSGGGGTSIDPGVQNVLTGVDYEIDGTPLVGTLVPVLIGSGGGVIESPNQAGVLSGQSLSAVLGET